MLKMFTIHMFIFILKQDIRIHVPYSRQNDWTKWADIFCGHSWVAGFGVCAAPPQLERKDKFKPSLWTIFLKTPMLLADVLWPEIVLS